MSSDSMKGSRPSFGVIVGALGIVFGDIGTSPLYALRECFHSGHLPIDETSILGVLSLFIWSLILVISLKYLVLILQADNRGEGGVLALMALASPQRARHRGVKRSIAISVLGLFGAALLYGDGAITPAISVLSAVEGLKVAAPMLEPLIREITILILVGLFVIQRWGTASIGRIFGPIILLWFLTLSILGLMQLIDNPDVLRALNPYYALQLFQHFGSLAFFTLGAVFLVVTGGEALYADLGHFGASSIRWGWFTLVLPGLLLNYLGQGALLLKDPSAVRNPFFLLAPDWAQIPLVVLATMATIIASQAVISGAFSLTRQAVQLGYLPRFAIAHTSSEAIGQIYVAAVNWILLVLTIWLVMEFQNSSSLAAAYGIAVSGTMVLTTILFFFTVRRLWRWSLPTALALLVPFLILDCAFLTANGAKIFEGGWVPLAIAAAIYTVMVTWRRGREILAERLADRLVPISEFMPRFNEYPRISGTAIFLTRNINLVPPALLHNLQHNHVLHERVILLTIEVEEVPYVPSDERYEIENLSAGFFRIYVYFGYRDEQNVHSVIKMIADKDMSFNPSSVVYFVGRETPVVTDQPGMAIWREMLFAYLSRNSQAATRYFSLPPGQVMEVGMQVEI